MVGQPDGPGLDGDAPLPLQVHVVQQLALHLPGGNGVALLQQPVRQRGLAVVNMGNDAEVSDVALLCHIRCSSIGKSTQGPPCGPGAERRKFKS